MRVREKSEKSLLTGVTLKETKEVKDNEVAHKEFLRIVKLLKKIEKNDDLYGAVINRYCILYAETKGFEEKRERMYSQLCELQGKMQEMIDLCMEFVQIKKPIYVEGRDIKVLLEPKN